MIIIVETVAIKVSNWIVPIVTAIFVTEFMFIVWILSINFIFQRKASNRIAVGSRTGCTIPVRYVPIVSIVLMLLEWIVAGIITSEIRFRICFLFVSPIDFRIVCIQLLPFQFFFFLLVHLRNGSKLRNYYSFQFAIRFRRALTSLSILLFWPFHVDTEAPKPRWFSFISLLATSFGLLS